MKAACVCDIILCEVSMLRAMLFSICRLEFSLYKLADVYSRSTGIYIKYISFCLV